MFKGLGNVFKTIVSRLGIFVEHAGGEAVGKIWSQQTERVMKEDPRHDVMETIRRLERVSLAKAEVLFARLDRAARIQKPDLENNVVVAMGHLIPRDKEGTVNWEEAVDIFGWLADKDDVHFAVVVEAMKHDPIAQIVRYWIGKEGLGGLQFIAAFLSESARLGWEVVRERLPEAEEIKRRLKDADGAVNSAVLRFRARQRWLKRSRKRQDRLESQLRELREQQTRERVTEAFGQFRRG